MATLHYDKKDKTTSHLLGKYPYCAYPDSHKVCNVHDMPMVGWLVRA